ncbi:MAG: flagellar protein FlaG [Deltaproteobacteria bacterium]|nr:flagellar protein FlaG [Deltaproteobacteria bacterium]
MDITANKVSAGKLSIPDSASTQQTAQSVERQKAFDKKGDVSSNAQVEYQSNVKEMTEKIQEYLDNRDVNIAFSTYGRKNEKISVTVTEKETGKVIREIPAEELQRLSLRMEELMGMIFNDQA